MFIDLPLSNLFSHVSNSLEIFLPLTSLQKALIYGEQTLSVESQIENVLSLVGYLVYVTTLNAAVV